MATQTGAEFKSATLDGLVCQAVEKFPNRISVTYDDGLRVENLSYKGLLDAAQVISCCLEEFEIRNETIGVYLPSHILAPAVLLGVLQVSANFACLDVSAPWHWNAQFAQRCPIKFTISLKNVTAKGLEEDFEEVKPFHCKGADFVLWKSKIVPQKSVQKHTKPLAYCVRTSGSTGLPKVVRVPHSCILPNIQDFK